jgi:trk system potassium uptake protein TrkA
MYAILVGGGKVGSYLAELLVGEGQRVSIIENQPNHLAALTPRFPPGVVIDGSGDDPEVLERAGIRQADVVVAVTGNDETNLVVTNLARFEFHVPYTVARVNNPHNRWLFTTDMGVDVAVDQANVIAHLVMEELSLGEMITLLKLRKGQYALVEERVAEDAVAAHQRIGDIALPPGSVISAVLRGGVLVIPHVTTMLLPGDEVLALVRSQVAPELAALLSSGASMKSTAAFAPQVGNATVRDASLR